MGACRSQQGWPTTAVMWLTIGGVLLMLSTPFALASDQPGTHPNDWPTAFTCDFAVRKDIDWSLSNSGKYYYNWTAAQRMLITNSNCTGGTPARTDLQCDALHRDGKLFAYGLIDSKPWCCLWHEFGPTPPAWRRSSTLINASTIFEGTPVAKYVLVGLPTPTSPTKYFYQALGSGLPVAYENGEGETFVYSNYSFSTIDALMFEFPSSSPTCNGECPWTAAHPGIAAQWSSQISSLSPHQTK